MVGFSVWSNITYIALIFIFYRAHSALGCSPVHQWLTYVSPAVGLVLGRAFFWARPLVVRLAHRLQS